MFQVRQEGPLFEPMQKQCLEPDEFSRQYASPAPGLSSQQGWGKVWPHRRFRTRTPQPLQGRKYKRGEGAPDGDNLCT